ncbi:MAG: phytanoyl-CoA dioxygenase family protein [Gemmatimonadetes bacterium]|nr:phytanoyl-CoA dioxygenase family protein [Gemmatimonadota bacterium]
MAAHPQIRLSDEQMAAYQTEGFVVVEDLLPPEQVVALRQRIVDYTHGGREPGGIKIQVEPRVTRGELSVDHPGDGIRKIDQLVEEDDLFRDLGLHDNIVGIIEQLLGPDLKMFRNALLLKPPRVGSQKGMHQDSPYWPIQPMELCSCWFALDDATAENGCMAAIPGGHMAGPLPHVRVTDDFVVDESAYEPDTAVMAPVRAGGGMFFHSLVPHATTPNQSDNWRRAIALSYMSARSRYTGEGAPPTYFPIRGRSFPGCVR